MPTSYFPRTGPERSGIGVDWSRKTCHIKLWGWFDSACGIEGDSLTLREFFDELGITEKDCQKAFKERK